MTLRAEKPPMRDGGFTLIEILAVLTILGLAIGIMAARGPSRSPSLDVRGTADLVAGSLRRARAQAIASNSAVAFQLDPAGYRVGGETPRRLPPGVVVTLGAPIVFAQAPGLPAAESRGCGGESG